MNREKKLQDAFEYALPRTLVISFFGIILIYAFVVFITTAFDREHMRQCLVWQEQSKEYPLFFLSEYNQAGCDGIGVSIDAPFSPKK